MSSIPGTRCGEELKYPLFSLKLKFYLRGGSRFPKNKQHTNCLVLVNFFWVIFKTVCFCLLIFYSVVEIESRTLYILCGTLPRSYLLAQAFGIWFGFPPLLLVIFLLLIIILILLILLLLLLLIVISIFWGPVMCLLLYRYLFHKFL